MNKPLHKPLSAMAALLWATCLQTALPAPPSASWPMNWGDEFTSATLDSTHWKSGALPWGGQHLNDEYASWITSEDSFVSGGSLWLRCRKAKGTEFGGYPYSQGMVATDGIKNFTYGYTEIRARFATGTGVWPAFWMLPQGWPPEFDIAEYFGSDDRMHMGLAHGSSWQDVQWDSSNFYNGSFGNWHTYGLEWGPGYAIWYEDGVMKKNIAASYVPSVPMYILINSGMRSEAAYTYPYTNLTEIDYCRIFTPPASIINDGTTGTNTGQFEFIGTWSSNSTEANAFKNDNHWSSTVNDIYRLRFQGARVDLYAALAPNHGIGGVSIDGGAETMVDFYASSRNDKALVWSSSTLTNTTHVLKMRVTGRKNAASTGLAVPIDRADVWTVAGRLPGTVIGTAGSWGNSGNTITNVFDSNLNTYLDSPNASESWVGLDLGASNGKRITKIRFCPRSGYSARMNGGLFQAANQSDFSDAVSLLTLGTTPPEERFTELNVSHTGGFRYVRYVSPTNGYCNVSEIEFLGTTPPNPATPYGLAATAMYNQVLLTWYPAYGAASYTVQRATVAGGPYTVLATNITDIRFLDTLVTNGTTYHYVITSNSSVGSSNGSSEINATPQSPTLNVMRLPDAEGLQFSWPEWATNFRVYTATNLRSPIQWTLLTTQPTATSFSYNPKATNQPQMFFRLGNP